ncbi:hypothetical protein CRE_20828 [Caenorhabditis remanei]|uniref:RING-type domain-containing protein n=1 Tax=Caenorhabditis remanei TaxID=31234 RepID=E3MV08_CAERE|nr:hypothetical protein CRE_20828 [Caenorhabditis remanei]
MSSHFTNIQDDNDSLKLMVQNMELELNHYKKYICNMAVEKQDDGLLKSQLSKCQKDYSQLLDEKNHCEINLDRQQSEIQKLKYSFERSEQKQIELEKNIETMRSNYAALGIRLRETEKHLKEKQREFDNLTKDLNSSRSQLQITNNELSNIKQRANNVVYYENEIQRLNSDFEKKIEEEYSVKFEETFKSLRTERNQLWDDMIFYKNIVDFPASSPNWESHITKLETQLVESHEQNQKLRQENSHLQGINDPDDCSICYEQLPLSRCLTENCKKNYHNKCIIRHFQGKEEDKQKCPYCNKRSVKIGIDCLGREKD